jgi:site-specific recombinase XerD
MYGDGTCFYSETRKTYIARYPAGRFGRMIEGQGLTEDKAKRNRDRALKRYLENPAGRSHNTVKGMLEKYYEWLDGGDRRANTLTRKKDRLNRYLKPYMALRISELDATICESIKRATRKASKDAHGRLPGQVYSEMHQFLDFCQKRKYIASNPLDMVEKPKYISKAKDANEQHIIERIAMGVWLLDYTGSHISMFSTEYGMVLAASLGLRAGEIRGLEWNAFEHLLDRDFEHTTLTVSQMYDRDAATGEWHIVKWTKSNAARWREISVPKEWAKNFFDLYIWQQDEIFNKFHLPYDYRGICFLTEQGTPFREQTQLKHWKNLKEKYTETHEKTASIDSSMRLHDLRHVVASLLVMHGATIEEIRPILGHADARTTEYYTHLASGFEKNTMAKLPGLFGHGENSAGFLADFGK